MPIKTIFLDRDGIINDVVIRDSVISSPRHPGEFHITKDFPHLYEVIRGLNLFVVTNQPDVSRKLLDESMLLKIHESLQLRFEIREIAYCPHDDAAQCDCRKPKPGMILRLLEKYSLRPSEAVIIGDSCKDIMAGQAAGLGTVYCRRHYNNEVNCRPDLIIDGLLELSRLQEYFERC